MKNLIKKIQIKIDYFFPLFIINIYTATMFFRNNIDEPIDKGFHKLPRILK